MRVRVHMRVRMRMRVRARVRVRVRMRTYMHTYIHTRFFFGPALSFKMTAEAVVTAQSLFVLIGALLR